MSIDRERERERTREAKGDSECKIDGKTLLYAYFAHFTTGFTFSLSLSLSLWASANKFSSSFQTIFMRSPYDFGEYPVYRVCVCV